MPGKLTKAIELCLASLLLANAGCAHGGEGAGELQAADKQHQSLGPITFYWSSGADASEGKIYATAPDGRMFEGTFVQPSSGSWQQSYDTYWNAWTSPAWGMGPPWYSGPRETYVTHYSGKALAHLTTSDGTRMRCSFTLYHPAAGMAGGAEGDCQLSTHERVFDAVLAERPR